MEVRDLFESMEYGAAPETTDRARQWLDERKDILNHYIGGQWVIPESGEYFKSKNPATGQMLAMVADGNEADVNRAVAAAADALEGWVAIGGHGRARYLYAMARHIQKNARLFSVLESLDYGKQIRESRDVDIPLVARHFYHHAGWAQVMKQKLPAFRPIGVVGQIIPWNFPLLMLAWKVAPALAMGNTVVPAITCRYSSWKTSVVRSIPSVTITSRSSSTICFFLSASSLYFSKTRLSSSPERSYPKSFRCVRRA